MKREIPVLAAVATGLTIVFLQPAGLIRNVLAPAALATGCAFLVWGLLGVASRPRSGSARRAGLLRLSVGVFIGASALFPRYLPDTPGLGLTHLGLVTVSGAVMLWLLLRRPRT